MGSHRCLIGLRLSYYLLKLKIQNLKKRIQIMEANLSLLSPSLKSKIKIKSKRLRLHFLRRFIKLKISCKNYPSPGSLRRWWASISKSKSLWFLRITPSSTLQSSHTLEVSKQPLLSSRDSQIDSSLDLRIFKASLQLNLMSSSPPNSTKILQLIKVYKMKSTNMIICLQRECFLSVPIKYTHNSKLIHHSSKVTRWWEKDREDQAYAILKAK